LVRVPKARSHKPKPWSVEEARRFLESARQDNDPLYAGYVLILVLGLRRGEALGLGWNEVDIDAGELRVAWQLQSVAGHLLRRVISTRYGLQVEPRNFHRDFKARCAKTGVRPISVHSTDVPAPRCWSRSTCTRGLPCWCCATARSRSR
jgi:integrase